VAFISGRDPQKGQGFSSVSFIRFSFYLPHPREFSTWFSTFSP